MGARSRAELVQAIADIEARGAALDQSLDALRAAAAGAGNVPVMVNLKTAAAIAEHSEESIRLWALNRNHRNRLIGARKVGPLAS